jgi:hypothetical protein
LKIHILTGGPERTPVDHPAVSKSRVTANRGRLRECERTCQGERGRERNRFEFHGHFLTSKLHQQIADWLYVPRQPRTLAAVIDESITAGITGPWK